MGISVRTKNLFIAISLVNIEKSLQENIPEVSCCVDCHGVTLRHGQAQTNSIAKPCIMLLWCCPKRSSMLSSQAWRDYIRDNPTVYAELQLAALRLAIQCF